MFFFFQNILLEIKNKDKKIDFNLKTIKMTVDQFFEMDQF